MGCLLFHFHLFSNMRTVVVREVTPWSCGRNDVVLISGSTFSPREWFHYGTVSTSELWNLHLWIVSRGIWWGYEVLRWVNCSWTVLFADPRGLGSYTVWPRPVSYPVSYHRKKSKPSYVYFTTKVDMTENIKYSIKYKNKMQSTDYWTEKERNKDYWNWNRN